AGDVPKATQGTGPNQRMLMGHTLYLSHRQKAHSGRRAHTPSTSLTASSKRSYTLERPGKAWIPTRRLRPDDWLAQVVRFTTDGTRPNPCARDDKTLALACNGDDRLLRDASRR